MLTRTTRAQGKAPRGAFSYLLPAAFWLTIPVGLNIPNLEQPIPSFFPELLAGLGILGLAAGPVALRYPPDSRWHALLLIPALAAVQYTTGLLRLGGDTALVAGYGLYAWVLAMLVSGRREQDELIRQIFLALFVAWLIGFCLQLLQWWGVKSLWLADMGNARPSGNLPQPNHFATWTVLSAYAALWLARCDGWPRLGILALLPCIAFSLTLSASRTSYLALALCAALAWLHPHLVSHVAPAPTVALRPYRLDLTILLLLTVAAVALRPAVETLLFGHSVTPPLLRPSSEGERLRLIGFALQAVWERPWAGWGLYQTPLAQISAAGEGLSRLLYPSAHNLFADLFLWLGIPLALLLCVGFLAVIFYALRPDTKQVDRLPLQGMLLALVLHAMLEYPLYYLMWLGLFVLLLVVLLEPSSSSHANATNAMHPKPWLHTLLQMGILGTGIVLAASYVALQERRAAYYLEGHCTYAAPLSAAIWQRHEMALDLLCGRPLQKDVDPLEIAVLAGSTEVFHKLYTASATRAPQRERILKAGCRLGAFLHYCAALPDRTD